MKFLIGLALYLLLGWVLTETITIIFKLVMARRYNNPDAVFAAFDEADDESSNNLGLTIVGLVFWPLTLPTGMVTMEEMIKNRLEK